MVRRTGTCLTLSSDRRIFVTMRQQPNILCWFLMNLLCEHHSVWGLCFAWINMISAGLLMPLPRRSCALWLKGTYTGRPGGCPRDTSVKINCCIGKTCLRNGYSFVICKAYIPSGINFFLLNFCSRLTSPFLFNPTH